MWHFQQAEVRLTLPMAAPRLRNKYQVAHRTRARPSMPGGWQMRQRVLHSMLVVAVVVSALGALCLTAPPACASPAPITLALVTSLTGPSAPETSSDPAGFLARIDLQNAAGGVNGHKLVPLVIDDQTSPAADRDGRAERVVQGGNRHRVGQPALLPRCQVPPGARSARDRVLYGRARVGSAALYEHVLVGPRQRRPLLSRQHPGGEDPQGIRRLRNRLLRLQHLPELVARGGPDRQVVRI